MTKALFYVVEGTPDVPSEVHYPGVGHRGQNHNTVGGSTDLWTGFMDWYQKGQSPRVGSEKGKGYSFDVVVYVGGVGSITVE